MSTKLARNAALPLLANNDNFESFCVLVGHEPGQAVDGDDLNSIEPATGLTVAWLGGLRAAHAVNAVSTLRGIIASSSSELHIDPPQVPARQRLPGLARCGGQEIDSLSHDRSGMPLLTHRWAHVDPIRGVSGDALACGSKPNVPGGSTGWAALVMASVLVALAVPRLDGAGRAGGHGLGGERGGVGAWLSARPVRKVEAVRARTVTLAAQKLRSPESAGPFG